MRNTVILLLCITALTLISSNLVQAQEKKDEPLFPIEQEGLWGYIDRTGKVLIKQQYYYATSFQEGLANVLLSKIKSVYIDKSGKEVIRSEILGVTSFREGLALFVLMGMGNLTYGYMDKTGKTAIEARYSFARDFSEGLAAVEISKRDRRGLNMPVTRWGFIDKQGKETIDFKFWDARSFSNGLAAVRVPNKGWGYVNKKGEIAISPDYQGAWNFSDGMALVNVGGKNPEPIQDVGCFPWQKQKPGSETPPKPEDRGKFGFIDRMGRLVIEAKYEGAASFSEGLAIVEIDKKHGYIDKTGKLVVEAKFDEAYGFHEGLAAVREGNKWGYIDKTGKTIIKPHYDEAWSFNNDLAAVYENKKMAYLNKTGKTIWKAPDKPDPELAEAGVIKVLHTISASQAIYSTRYAEFGTMEDLIKKVRLDEELASGKKNGYIFELKAEKNIWSCVARPENPGKTGKRSFFIDQNGVIRYKKCTSHRDSLADKDSDVLR